MVNNQEQILRRTALQGLAALAEWGKFSEVLANGNWDKVFALLPENLSDEPITPREEELLTFFEEIAEAISEDLQYSNAFLQRVVVYLFNPITKQGAKMYHVCHSLSLYIASLHPANPIELDYEAILERLLQFTKEDYMKEEEGVGIVLAIFMAMSMMFSTGRLDEPKYLKIRKQVLGEFVAIIEAGWLPRQVLVALLAPGITVSGDNEDLVETIFDCEKFMKLVHFRMTKKVDIDLSLSFLGCCKVCPKRGVEFFMKNNIMQSVILLLKSLQNENPELEEFDNILEALEILLMQAESLVNGNETLYNPIALQIEGKRGLKILKELENSEDHDASAVAKRINCTYFGEGWENYLARRRGLKTKRAK